MTMTPAEEKKVKEWNLKLQHQFEVRLILTGDHRSQDFEAFYHHFFQLAPSIILSVRQVEEGLPHIKIGGSIKYHALARDGELPVFLDAVSYFHNGARAKSKNSEKQGESGDALPSFLKLFITRQCPYCPTMVRRVFPLAESLKNVRIEIIDGTLFPESAEAFGISSVPAIILDDDFRLNGMVGSDELKNFIVSRDPSRLGSQSLENFLKEGNASQLAEMMMAKGTVFPAFIELLIHEKWPTRLGAMVVLEDILGKDRALAETVIPPLRAAFSSLSDQVKGDVIYLFGQIASPQVLPLINSVINDNDNAEIHEAAVEALENIEKGTCRGQETGIT